MQATTAFSPAARAFIADLCNDLTKRLKCPVSADYGQTECGEVHDVALCVESLPAGSWGRPGPLASILTGPGIPGGFVVLDAQGVPTVDGVQLEAAVQAAKSQAVRCFQGLHG
jgi:acyl-coenzyme A synthetase/AMP-(fatty) acid ligase